MLAARAPRLSSRHDRLICPRDEDGSAAEGCRAAEDDALLAAAALAGLPGEGGGVQRSHEEHRKAKARARARAKQARKARRKNR